MDGPRRRAFQILEQAESGDRLSRAVDCGLITLIFFNVLAVVFETVDSIYLAHAAYFDGFEVFSVAVFTVEYVVRVWVCIDSTAAKKTGSAHWAVRLRYMLSVSAIIDLLAILPFYLLRFGLLGTVDMRFLRVVRLVRIFKLTRYSTPMTLLLNALRDNGRTFGAALTVLLVVMLLAASGIYLFERDAQPEAFGNIPASMWWAFVTLTTVGYGDVTPITAGGKVFGAMITVVGVGMVALPAGILASAFSQQVRLKEENYRDLADEVYEDGRVSADEEVRLETTRVDLGLNEAMAARILAEERTRAIARNLAAHNVCPHCGGHIEGLTDRLGSTVWLDRGSKTAAS